MLAKTRRRRLISGALALTTGLGALGVAAMQPAEARYATDGSGAYKGSIDWFEWGTEGQVIPNAGITVDNTRTIAGQDLTTTCEISPFSGTMRATHPGGYGGTALDDLYNIGGTGNSNQLVSALTVSSSVVEFGFGCSATLDGVPVPLGGLVMADAEYTLGGNEYMMATIADDATWRILESFKAAGCTEPGLAHTDPTGNTLQLRNDAGCGVGPMAIAFMDGATSADMRVRGGGTSMISLGVVLSSDFGDAPASYGAKGAMLAPEITGGELADGAATDYTADGFVPATLGQPVLRLGAGVTSEQGPYHSPAADGDVDVDDALAITTTGPTEVGATYSVDTISCAGEGAPVAAWLDWNRDGDFDDAGEASTVGTCASGVASVGWTVPADAVTSVGATPSFLRLAIGPDADAVAAPTGMMLAGEVEDYAIEVTLTPTAAQPDAVTVPAGTPTITIDPLVNDTATPGATLDPTSVRLVDGNGGPVTDLVVPGEGTWTVDPGTGEITFVPESGFVGTATPVTYQVTDSNGATVEGQLTVSLAAAAAGCEDGLALLNEPGLDVDRTYVLLSGGIHKGTEDTTRALVDPLTVPLLGLNATDLVHQVNCQIVEPVEDLVDAITVPLIQNLGLQGALRGLFG